MSDWKLLNTSTASGASSVEFTDLTGYKIFKFVFVDVNPSAYSNFSFNGSIDAGLNYNVTKTTTWFRAEHYENDSSSTLAYAGGNDLAQSASDQMIFQGMDNDADDAGVAELFLFNPMSTTYVKHFYATGNYKVQTGDGLSTNLFMAGYFNDVNDVDAVIFRPSTGTFDGVIKQYGLVAT